MMTRAVDGTVVREFIYGPDDERLVVYDVPNGKWTWEVRGTDAKVLRELTSTDGAGGKGTANWAWSKDYVYREGLLLASVSATGTYHYHLDHLGTPRLVTDGGGSRIAEHDYYPFGAEVANSTTESPQERMKFTGHERDTLAGDNHTLDYMHARYYGAAVGRFLSTDPSKAGNNRGAPQSWNRYVYGLNNPNGNVDRNGMWPTPIHNAIIDGAFRRLTTTSGRSFRTPAPASTASPTEGKRRLSPISMVCVGLSKIRTQLGHLPMHSSVRPITTQPCWRD
jgi:RHS repeat-associated protein